MIDTHENNSVVASFPDRELLVLGEITHVAYDSEGKPCGIDFFCPRRFPSGRERRVGMSFRAVSTTSSTDDWTRILEQVAPSNTWVQLQPIRIDWSEEVAHCDRLTSDAL